LGYLIRICSWRHQSISLHKQRRHKSSACLISIYLHAKIPRLKTIFSTGVLAPPVGVGLEPTTARLTVFVGRIPLCPPVPNSPILMVFLDSVEIMEMEIFHYFHTFQKNVEQNREQKNRLYSAPETCDKLFCNLWLQLCIESDYLFNHSLSTDQILLRCAKP